MPIASTILCVLYRYTSLNRHGKKFTHKKIYTFFSNAANHVRSGLVTCPPALLCITS
uniref:Uncharacterized protein n=1 Tax=Arundo donax TaxID=35708 RepID=A0A0A9DG12_ARUDO